MKFVLLPSADADIVLQFSWYAEQRLQHVARRFRSSVESTIELALSAPKAGAPKLVRNPALRGRRSWPVKGLTTSEFTTCYVRTCSRSFAFYMAKETSAPFSKSKPIDDPDAD